jgi:hypothetical protein
MNYMLKVQFIILFFLRNQFIILIHNLITRDMLVLLSHMVPCF